MQDFWDVFPVIIIFPTIAIVIKWFLEYRMKQRLIEKGMVDDRVKFLQNSTLEQYAPSSLKWGMVFTLVGIGVIVLQAFPYYVSGETVLGTMLVCAGVGLLAYYFIANSMRKKHLDNNPEDSKL